jgi:hypothetical protein
MVLPSAKEDGTMPRVLELTDEQFTTAVRDGCSDHGIPEAIEAILAEPCGPAIAGERRIALAYHLRI